MRTADAPSACPIPRPASEWWVWRRLFLFCPFVQLKVNWALILLISFFLWGGPLWLPPNVSRCTRRTSGGRRCTSERVDCMVAHADFCTSLVNLSLWYLLRVALSDKYGFEVWVNRLTWPLFPHWGLNYSVACVGATPDWPRIFGMPKRTADNWPGSCRLTIICGLWALWKTASWLVSTTGCTEREVGVVVEPLQKGEKSVGGGPRWSAPIQSKLVRYKTGASPTPASACTLTRGAPRVRGVNGS